MSGQEIAKPQRSKKFMEEVDTAIVGQTRMITGYLDVSRRIWHFSNS
jgi:hypothetical protein